MSSQYVAPSPCGCCALKLPEEADAVAFDESSQHGEIVVAIVRPQHDELTQIPAQSYSRAPSDIVDGNAQPKDRPDDGCMSQCCEMDTVSHSNDGFSASRTGNVGDTNKATAVDVCEGSCCESDGGSCHEAEVVSHPKDGCPALCCNAGAGVALEDAPAIGDSCCEDDKVKGCEVEDVSRTPFCCSESEGVADKVALKSVCGDSCCDGDDGSGSKVASASELPRDGVMSGTAPTSDCTPRTGGRGLECNQIGAIGDKKENSICIKGCCILPDIPESKSYGSNLQEDGSRIGSSLVGACICCVSDILRTSLTPVDANALGSPGAAGNVERYSNILRRCCALIEKCCRRSCCFVNGPPLPIPSRVGKISRVCEPFSTQEPQRPLPPVGESTRPGSTLLQLEIRGMDCADCVPKVARVLSRLPSVTAIETDYFAGMTQLRFNPDAISASAISSYLNRATGFTIRDVTGKEARSSSDIVLPIIFRDHPPPVITSKFDLAHKAGRIWSTSIRVTGEQARLPRDVIAELELHGGRLEVESAGLMDNPANHDFRALLLRTTLCTVFTLPVLILAWAPLRPAPAIFGALQVGFSTVVQFLAIPMYASSLRSILFIHQVDMNVLAVISIFISYVFSAIAYALELRSHSFSAPFFETSTLLVTLIYIGRTVQAATRKSATSAISALHQMQCREVTLVQGVQKRSIDSRLMHYGDVIEVQPQAIFATDGVITSGFSDADESSATGESAPIIKVPGNLVLAGTRNLTGVLQFQVTRLTHENSLAKITQMIQRAQGSRVPLQDLADKLSAIVLPVAVTVAGLAFLTWTLVNAYQKKTSVTDAVIDGLMKAITVLIVSCPCAIGLAIPMVTAVSFRTLARSGVLVRSADALHLSRRISVVAFDKTGTLSDGSFTVTKSAVFIDGAERLIYDLVKGDSHPIARGLARFLEAKLCSLGAESAAAISEVSSLPGKGLKIDFQGYEVLGGSASFTGTTGHPAVAKYMSSGLSLFTVTFGGTCLAVYGLTDLPRPEAAGLVGDLQNIGKEVVILSGDNIAAVSQFAAKIGLRAEGIHHSCTPEDKQAIIRSFQSARNTVLFVGDGTNDGPALAIADVSLAVSSGSEVAQTTAGAILLHKNIQIGIMSLLSAASKANWRTRLSLIWCAAYMVFAMVFASGAAVNFAIEPRWAGLGEIVSILPVVLIGLSMKWI